MNFTGAVKIWAGANIPAGHLACEGQLVSRVAYADLFNVLGVTYGSGDGSTTFALPDYRGYFVRGKDSGAGRDINARTGTDVNSTQASLLMQHNHYALAGGFGGGNVFWSGGGNNVNLATGVAGGNQTAPINISKRAIIKY